MYFSDQTVGPCQKLKLNSSHFLSFCTCFDHSDPSHILRPTRMTLHSGETQRTRGTNTVDSWPGHWWHPSQLEEGMYFLFRALDAEPVLTCQWLTCRCWLSWALWHTALLQAIGCSEMTPRWVTDDDTWSPLPDSPVSVKQEQLLSQKSVSEQHILMGAFKRCKPIANHVQHIVCLV